MKKYILNKYTMFILGTIFFFLVWWLISLIVDNQSMIVPSPINTFIETGNVLTQSYTYLCVLYSLLRMILGFIIALILALVLSFLVYNNEHLYNFFTPSMTILKVIPTAAVIFLFVVVNGSSLAPVMVVALISFPILYEAIANGLRNTNKDILNASQMDGATKVASLFKVRVPLALPYMIIGIITSFSLSFKIEIMAEVITGSTKDGIGCLIKGAQINNPTDMTQVFAYSLIAIVLMLIVSFVSMIIRKKLELKVD